MFALISTDLSGDTTIVERSRSVEYLKHLRQRYIGNDETLRVVPLSERTFIQDFGSMLPDMQYFMPIH